MSAEEIMFNEVLSALDKNEPARARDLLTRLIKSNPNNPQYWLYMSAVVESQRERLYCLKEAQKLAPDDPAVKRGLAIFGESPVDPALVIPLAAQKRNWRAQMEKDLAASKTTRPLTRRQIAGIMAGVLGLAGIVVLIVILASNVKQQQAVAIRRTIVLPTAGPTSTFLPTPSPVVRLTEVAGATPLPAELRPEVPYTATPLYVQTQHTISENFTAGMRAYGRGDFASAVTFLQSAVSEVPGAPDIYYYIAEAQRQQGNGNAALENYNLALEAQENFSPALLGRAQLSLLEEEPDLEDIQVDLEAAVMAEPAYADAWLELAHVQLLAGDVEGAQAVLVKAEGLERGQESPMLYLYQAQANLLLDDPQAALQDAQKANQMDISLLAAYRTLGEIYHQLGQDAKSIPPLEIYARYATSDSTAPALLGIAYARSGQLEQALEWLNKALEMNEQQAQAHAWRGLVLLEQEEAADAYQDFDRALLLDGEFFSASLGRARALLALKYPTEAFDQFNRVEKLAESSVEQGEYLYYYAQALEQVGSLVPALNAWKELLEIPPAELKSEWQQMARQRVAALSSPTPTATFTRTPTPTRTATLTRTPTRRITP